jgi:serine/threonine protein kinase
VVDELFHGPEWSWRQAGSVGWWVRPDWLEDLVGPMGLRLEEWRRQGRVATVKSGPQRTVYRVELPRGAVFVKHFRVPSFRERWRQWLRRGKGRNEAKRAVVLARYGVLTIYPIALGEERRRNFLYENYLVSREITGAIPLDLFLGQSSLDDGSAAASRLRRTLAIELARLTARLHNAGAVHQDFHPGNVLVRRLPSGSVELAMIDLDALRFRRNVDWASARHNLAQLNHGFRWRTTRTDRLRFLRAYLAERAAAAPMAAPFARSIEDATSRWAERLWRRWGRRCHGSNKYFHTRKIPGAWAVGSRALDASTIDSLLSDPDAIFGQSATRVLKDSRTTTVAETVLPVYGKPTPVIYKRFNRKKRLDPWLALFRPSRGWRAWQAGQHLLSRGIPTPTNLLYIRQTHAPRGGRFSRLRFLPRNTYLLTVKAHPSTTVADWIREGLAKVDSVERRGLVLRYTRALARLIRALHERSLAHRDLKAANILIVGDPHAPEPELSLIDLVGVVLQHPLARRRKIQNLARLHLSLLAVPGRTRADALRFLRWYLPWGQTTRAQWKDLWRAVVRAAGSKAAKNERSGRILS